MKIVAFPFHDWRKSEAEGFRTRDAHLLQEFARDPRVEEILVIDRPASLIERAVRRHGAGITGQVVGRATFGRSHARLTSVDDCTRVLDIDDPGIVAPARSPRGWWFDVFRNPATLDAIDWALQRTDSGDAAWFAWTPTPAGAFERFHPRQLVFDSLDNWLIHPVLRREHARARAGYASMLPNAEQVYVSGPASGTVLSQWSNRVTLMPNGVDPNAFFGPFPRPLDLPKGPVVGYAGKLAERIDSELVRDTALSLPSISFVFVGQVLERRSLRPMLRIPNVHVLGDRHYDLIPAYMRAFDIAWIPHRVGQGETGGDPIKMYEYWAAGRQVVATPIDGISVWRDQLHLVSTADDAAAAVRGLIDGSIVPTAVAVPPDRTWGAIADRMLSNVSAADDLSDRRGRPGSSAPGS